MASVSLPRCAAAMLAAQRRRCVAAQKFYRMAVNTPANRPPSSVPKTSSCVSLILRRDGTGAWQRPNSAGWPPTPAARPVAQALRQVYPGQFEFNLEYNLHMLASLLDTPLFSIQLRQPGLTSMYFSRDATHNPYHRPQQSCKSCTASCQTKHQSAGNEPASCGKTEWRACEHTVDVLAGCQGWQPRTGSFRYAAALWVLVAVLLLNPAASTSSVPGHGGRNSRGRHGATPLIVALAAGQRWRDRQSAAAAHSPSGSGVTHTKLVVLASLRRRRRKSSSQGNHPLTARGRCCRPTPAHPPGGSPRAPARTSPAAAAASSPSPDRHQALAATSTSNFCRRSRWSCPAHMTTYTSSSCRRSRRSRRMRPSFTGNTQRRLGCRRMRPTCMGDSQSRQMTRRGYTGSLLRRERQSSRRRQPTAAGSSSHRRRRTSSRMRRVTSIVP